MAEAASSAACSNKVMVPSHSDWVQSVKGYGAKVKRFLRFDLFLLCFVEIPRGVNFKEEQ